MLIRIFLLAFGRGRCAAKFLSIASLPFVLSACAGNFLSSAGPSINSIVAVKEESQYSLVDLTASSILPFIRKPDEAPLPDISTTESPDIRLVPGDVLKVLIADDAAADRTLFAPLSAGGTVFTNVRVDSSGTLSLPYVGRQKVLNMTLRDVEKTIRTSISGRAIEPQVIVELVGDISGSVLVAGAVKAPGRFSTLQGPLTLVDAINRAGGPVMEPHLTRVVMRTGTAAFAYNYEDLLSGKNLIVPPRSEIVVERARKRFVAIGSVEKPGLHDLPSNNPSLLEVLGTVGGLRESTADASGVFVFRYFANSDKSVTEPVVIRLDMSRPEAFFLAREFLVLPEDAIYVTTASVYEWQKIISPIVQTLVLGRTLRNGF